MIVEQHILSKKHENYFFLFGNCQLEALGKAIIDVPFRPNGIGYAKNRATFLSSGSVLFFLDSDDIMSPERINRQIYQAIMSPLAIIGSSWKRFPSGSTVHFEKWSNLLSTNDIFLEQFRENTIQMPTWSMTRRCFENVGSFKESSPESGEAEDSIFFYKHLNTHEEYNLFNLKSSLLRTGCHKLPLMLYRWTQHSGTSRVPRRRLLHVRVSAFEKRILSKSTWRRFQIWGAGRDARNFITALSDEGKKKITVLLDIDKKKIGKFHKVCLFENALTFDIPIKHFSSARSGMSTVVCVAKRRKGEYIQSNELEQNISSLGLLEGETLWYFH